MSDTVNDNRLGDAVSPYLRQHAGNPVDWREWGPDAFAEARVRDVPVLVSIGYATCHWCHVMARESFEDEAVAAYLREHTVSVKVDREERPDVDASTMAAASAFTQQLGWPLTAFMTPDARVFYAATYLPPRPVGEHPSFRMVLDAVMDAWTNRREECEQNAASIATAIRQGAAAATTVDTQGAAADATTGDGEPGVGAAPGLPAVDAISHVVTALEQAEDTTYGGLGGAPKFPNAPMLEFLADVAADGDARAAALRDRSVRATTGLRDADGGFFRYATRRDWTVPHYERMLYDNAGLLPVVDHGTATGIGDFLATTLRVPDGPAAGAFVAAQDSESTIDGERREGDWYRLSLAERAAHEPPPLDDQVLTGWNGLAIRGLALAGARHRDDRLVRLAVDAADAVIAHHLDEAGHVRVRSSTPRGASSAAPTIEDVGLLADGLLELALVTGVVRYAGVARTVVGDGLEALLGSGAVAAVGGTGASGTPEVGASRPDGTPEMGASRPDGTPGPRASRSWLAPDPVLAAAGTDPGEQPQTALRSGTVALASAAATLAALTGDTALRTAATRLVADRAATGVRRPLGHTDALGLALALQRPSREVVVVAPVGREGDAMRAAVAGVRRPGTVVAVVTPEQAEAWAAAGFSLFEQRSAGAPAAYVCHDQVCALPAHSAEELVAQLA